MFLDIRWYFGRTVFQISKVNCIFKRCFILEYGPFVISYYHCILQKEVLFSKSATAKIHLEAVYKSERYTFRGSNSTIYAPSFNRGQPLKERIFSPGANSFL